MSEKKWPYKTGGIPDEMFIRDKVPMTKAEVRVITLAKARLKENHVIWDIGAGTGSISIEAALAAAQGRVFAIERDTGALALIEENIRHFGLSNITVCPGAAPGALQGLPQPDRVFIGGSGGRLTDIIRHAYGCLVPGGRVVINAVVLETLLTSVSAMKDLGAADLDVTQVSVAKTVDLGGLHMFQSHNPVFVISGEKK